MRRTRSTLLAICVVALAACSKPDGCASAAAAAPGGPANPVLDAATYAPALQVDLNAATKSASGLYYQDLKVGCGPAAVPGQQVGVIYTGRLADGTQFDATHPGQPPYPFILGAHAVVPGWDEGIAGMRVGGKRLLIIPASLGYGPAGRPPVIPPGAIMVFNVELASLK